MTYTAFQNTVILCNAKLLCFHDISLLSVTTGLHLSRRYIGLPHFFSLSPFIKAHVQYNLSLRPMYDAI